jgi:hypothetical protein
MVSRTLIRDLPDRSRVVVHLHLREGGDPGELSPDVFSATTDRYEPHGTRSGKWRHRRDRDPDSCGCEHDVALLAFPELAPLVDLHLADSDTGEPMHAEANARYFYRTARGLPGRWRDDCQHAELAGLTVEARARRVVCSMLRMDEIPLDDVPDSHDLRAARLRRGRERDRAPQLSQLRRAVGCSPPTGFGHPWVGAARCSTDPSASWVTRWVTTGAQQPHEHASTAQTGP